MQLWGTPPVIGHNAEFWGISTQQLAFGLFLLLIFQKLLSCYTIAA